MSTKFDQTITRLEGSILITKVLKPLVEAGAVFLWLITLVEVVRAQNYNGNLTFDLFLARVGGPTASHATTYLIFLSIFPIAYALLRSIIPAFLIEVLAFEIHEGLWQLPYYIAWHSVVDWRVLVLQDTPDAATTVVAVAVLILVYHLPGRFFALVTAAWGVFLLAWLALGFPVSVLSKLPGNLVVPSVNNTTLWVNQIESLGWAYFASVLLVCLWYFARGRVHPTRLSAATSPDEEAPVETGA
ncbi:MAG: hypothetical protein OK456_02180 [Thaumarchaeota archaeon]|nr:hypothetical protein [Nitrososphaerota archaeon]